MSNLSPTIHILEVGVLNLHDEFRYVKPAGRNLKFQLQDTSIECKRINREDVNTCAKLIQYYVRDLTKCTYFCSKKSMRNVDGFPTTTGSFSVVPHTAATIHPAPAVTEMIHDPLAAHYDHLV